MAKTSRSRSGVKLVCIDAMFTTLRPAHGTRKTMIADIYREVGEVNNSVSDELIRELILDRRFQYRRFQNDEDYWFMVNWSVFSTMAEYRSRRMSAKRCALEVHARITSDPLLYEPDPEMIALIQTLRREKIRVVLASNQEKANLAILLDHHKLNQYFDQVYTSEALDTRKPFPEFWSAIMSSERQVPKRVVHIGNSLNSDIGAARLGIRTLIWDPRGHVKAIIKRHREDRFYHPDFDAGAFTELLHSGLVSPFTHAKQGVKLIQAWGQTT